MAGRSRTVEPLPAPLVRVIWVVIMGMFLVQMDGTMLGVALIVPLYFQLARGWSALHAGLVAGAGLGATMVAATAASYRDVPRPDIPRATSAIRIFQQLGGSLGAAVLSIVLQGQLTDHLRLATAAGAPAATSAAFAATFVWAVAITAVAVLPALLLPRRAAVPAATAPR